MNEISLMFDFIINKFKGNVLVNTISILPTIEMDMNKETIFPLVNIDFRETEVLDDVIVCSFKMTVIQQRDIKPIVIDNKLLSNTNFVDNLNETHSIAQKFINQLTRQNNNENIEIQDVTKLTILKDYGMSGCDGVQFEIDLITPNIGSSC